MEWGGRGLSYSFELRWSTFAVNALVWLEFVGQVELLKQPGDALRPRVFEPVQCQSLAYLILLPMY